MDADEEHVQEAELGSTEEAEASKETSYEEASHPQYILSLLEKDSKYCNITLEAGGEKIKVHESVFGTYSDFFDKAFTVEMNEKYTKEVKLEVSAEVLQSIVNFLYTGKISIKLENAFELLAAADYLMIDKVKQFSETFLTENINASNWHDMWHNAEKYRLPELTKSTAIYIGRNLKSIVDENGLDVFSAAELKLITKKSKTFRESEEETYEVIVAWVKKDRDRRMPLLDGLFCNLEICQFTPETLKKVVLREELVRNSVFIMTLIAETLSAINDKLIEENHQLKLQPNSKNTPNYLLAVDKSYAVHLFDFSQKVWKTLNQCTANVRDESGDCFRSVGEVGDMHVFERKINNYMKIISSVPALDGFGLSNITTTQASGFGFGATTSLFGDSIRQQTHQVTQKQFIFADTEGTICTFEKGANAKHVYEYDKMTNQWMKINTEETTGLPVYHSTEFVSVVQTNQKLQSNPIGVRFAASAF